MRPVILVKLPNSATFVGTFDVENWRDWWKSEPLPGSVAKITDTDWAYGQYHVAICHMTNGTWSIYRSGDYGKTWYEVWNTPVTLHGIIQIDPGWLLCSASDGWYESINSGLEWNKISSQAPNCPIVVNLGDDVLMAHDGLNVWKSVNKGRNWALKINARSYTVYAYHNGERRTGGWSGDSYPALDGCGNQVIIGIGPYLFVSDNAGETWNESWWYYDGASELFPQILPYTDKRVLQVLLTDVSGSGPEDTAYMVRIYHKAAGIVRHYYMNRPYIGMSARFDQPFSGYTDGKLTAYQVLHPGASYYDQVVFSSQMARNTDTNTYYPSVKYSADGGWTWVDLNINDFKVFEGDPSQGVFSQGGPFIEDFLTKYSWSGDPCHNSGKYSQISSGWVRMLSWDMDFLAKGFGDKTFSSDMISSIRVTQSLPFDLRMSKKFDQPCLFDIATRKEMNAPCFSGFMLSKTIDAGKSFDVINMIPVDFGRDFDIAISKKMNAELYSRVALQRCIDQSCGMNTILVNSYFEESLIDVEKYMPQLFELWAKMLQYDVFDSRKHSEV